MIEYMQQIDLVEPRGMFEQAFVAQAAEEIDFSHFIFFVEFANGEKLADPGVCALKPNVIEVNNRPWQVISRLSEKDVETIFCRRIVINVDNDEAQGAAWGKAAHEMRQGFLNVTKDEPGIRR